MGQDISKTLNLLKEAEYKYFQQKALLLEAKTKLALKQADLIISGKINGKNEEMREAQLIQHARDLYIDVKQKEKTLFLLKAEYNSLLRMWESFFTQEKPRSTGVY